MELTPELYKTIKSSLLKHEKIVFEYPGANGMRRYDSLSDCPLDLRGGDSVTVIVEYTNPTTKHTSIRMWAEFAIDIAKFDKNQIRNDKNISEEKNNDCN